MIVFCRNKIFQDFKHLNKTFVDFKYLINITLQFLAIQCNSMFLFLFVTLRTNKSINIRTHVCLWIKIWQSVWQKKSVFNFLGVNMYFCGAVTLFSDLSHAYFSTFTCFFLWGLQICLFCLIILPKPLSASKFFSILSLVRLWDISKSKENYVSSDLKWQ